MCKIRSYLGCRYCEKIIFLKNNSLDMKIYCKEITEQIILTFLGGGRERVDSLISNLK